MLDAFSKAVVSADASTSPVADIDALKAFVASGNRRLDAVNAIAAVGHGCCCLADELPGGRARHFHTGLFHQVGTVHDH